MTREWFEDNITDFDELIEFCDNNGCDVLEGLHHEDDFDSFVCDDIRDATRNEYWNEIRSELNRIYDERGGDYFFYNGRFDYVWVSSDYNFEEYKTRVIEWAEYEAFFDAVPDDDVDDEKPEEESASEDDGFETPDFATLFG